MKRNQTLQEDDVPTAERPQKGVYMATIMLRVPYKVPMLPRIECLKSDGTGGIGVLDMGMRVQTIVHVKCLERTAMNEMRVEVKAVEELTGMTALIRPALVQSARLRSKAGRSRARRLKDPTVVSHLRRVQARADEHKAAGEDVPFALNKELGVAKAHGAFKDQQYKSEVDELVEDDEEADAKKAKKEPEGNDGAEDMAGATRELDEGLKARLGAVTAELDAQMSNDTDRTAMARKNQDEYLDPLCDAERYEKHCASRRERELEVISPRRFFKILERRARRAAKTNLCRVQGEVIRQQDEALRRLIPIGTSLVFSGRLNFHEFKLHKRIMAVFGVLALCSYWDRMFIYCVNRGIDLVEVCEAYTTQQCPCCHKRIKVGAAKEFKCTGGAATSAPATSR